MAIDVNAIRSAFYLAASDTKARYKRSVLGPFWPVLTTAIGVAGLGYVWSMLFGMKTEELVPSLTIGVVIWHYLSGVFVEGTRVYVNSYKTIQNIKMPFLFFVLHSNFKHFYSFLHSLVIVVFVLILYPPVTLGVVQLLAIPGLIIVMLNLIWISMFLALIAARFRDIEQLVTSIMPILFLISPVIYRPDQLSINKMILYINPFSSLIEVIRSPLQGYVPSLLAYSYVLAMLVVGSLLTFVIYRKYSRNLVFWL